MLDHYALTHSMHTIQKYEFLNLMEGIYSISLSAV